ncbi:hypothetical protein CK216_00220 [Mesorhizobium sp. WSM3876]|nr:hypothetical protein CK216_00220 [Mesorhizobium sp. WSM3876]
MKSTALARLSMFGTLTLVGAILIGAGEPVVSDLQSPCFRRERILRGSIEPTTPAQASGSFEGEATQFG